MRLRDLIVGDFVEEPSRRLGKGYVISIISNDGKRLPPMATVLWSDGTSTTRWQDDLILVEAQEYLIQ